VPVRVDGLATQRPKMNWVSQSCTFAFFCVRGKGMTALFMIEFEDPLSPT
jgi:hypothetical protein